MDTQSTFKVLVDSKEIQATIGRLAAAIRADYRNKNPLLLGILKGSFIFLADLIRQLDFPLEIDFVRLSSYGNSTISSGKVKLVNEPVCNIQGKDILIVEDIIDTGYSVEYLIHYLQQFSPSSIRVCALADKPSRREVPVTINYLGFTVPDKFIIGYGIDWAEQYRYLPDICIVEEKNQ